MRIQISIRGGATFPRGVSRSIERDHFDGVADGRSSGYRETARGLYFLDEEVWVAVQRTRRRIAIVMLLIVVLLLVGTALGTIKW